MFTVEQIGQAHSKVRSGADFPAYIRQLKQLGITRYETFVAVGHTDYFGDNSYTISSAAKYQKLHISEQSDTDSFKAGLKAHQEGKTDYLTFCNDCARSGIEKWVVNMAAMTCNYYNKSESEILEERIPE